MELQSKEHYIEHLSELKDFLAFYIKQNGLNSLLSKIQVGGFPKEPIQHHTTFLFADIKTVARIYCILNDITSPPLCKINGCGNQVKWSNYKTGFRNACSPSCSSKYTAILRAEKNLQEHDWRKEWKDMPEFVQDKKEPFAKIIIRFETEEDLRDFEKLVNQKLTKKTKSIWFPFKSHWGAIKKLWIDEK